MTRDEILRKVKTIELQMRGMTDHVFSGQYQSAFKGRGMSFSEVRNYQIGDDVRAIDWNVTARYREPYIKVFEEERELSVMLIIDISGSMFFGAGLDSKLSLAVETLATIGFSAAKKNDKIGAIFVSDTVEFYIPPKKGFGHVHFLLRKLLDFQPKSKKTNLNEGFKLAHQLLKQRSICFVVSDFTSTETLHDGIATVAQRHDFIALHLSDLGESELPNIGFVQWINAEDGTTTWLDSSDRKVRIDYKSKFLERIQNAEKCFIKLNIDSVFLSVGDDVHRKLLTLFKKHK
jgi:uncharacterized protein (DUF58 family)